MNKRLMFFFGLAIFAISCSCDRSAGLSAQECYNQGQALLKEGNKVKAYKMFSVAVKKDTSAPRYKYAAALSAPDKNSAFIHALNAWSGGLKNYAVLGALSELSLQTNNEQRLGYTLGLFNELPDSLKTAEFRGDIFHRFNSIDSAISIWNNAYESRVSSRIINKIAGAYIQTRRVRDAIAFLESSRKNGQLDASGYSFLSTAYGLIDSFDTAYRIYAEARSSGRFDASSLVNTAMVNLAAGNNSAAEGILTEILENYPDSRTETLRDARGLLLLVYADRRDSAGITGLLAGITGDNVVDKAERTFLEGTLQLVKGDTTGRKKIIVAQRVLSGSVAVRLIIARQELADRNFENALKLYGTLPTLLTHSPMVAMDIARAQASIGNTDAALMIVSTLHRRKIYTKETLSLFRDLALSQQLIEKAAAAQAVLEKEYGNDVQVQWAGAIMASKAGKLDTALILFEKLCKKYPGNELFEKAKVTTLVLQKQYDRAISECNASGLSVDLATLKAHALYEQGKTQEAANAFEQAIKAKKSRLLLLDYAKFLITIKDNVKAASTLKELIDSSKTDKNKNQGIAMAALLNNFVWSAMQSGLYDAKDLVVAAQRANEIAPGNPKILDTYAASLIFSGKSGECLALLDTCSLTPHHANLLVRQAIAAENRKDNNKAIRAYRRAIVRIDSVADETCSMSRSDIEGAIARLNTEVR